MHSLVKIKGHNGMSHVVNMLLLGLGQRDRTGEPQYKDEEPAEVLQSS
jgi:hypothetical protein